MTYFEPLNFFRLKEYNFFERCYELSVYLPWLWLGKPAIRCSCRQEELSRFAKLHGNRHEINLQMGCEFWMEKLIIQSAYQCITGLDLHISFKPWTFECCRSGNALMKYMINRNVALTGGWTMEMRDNKCEIIKTKRNKHLNNGRHPEWAPQDCIFIRRINHPQRKLSNR